MQLVRRCYDSNAYMIQHLAVMFAVKVVIRGARKTGKTALLARLQGKPLPPEYTPTPEIQTATITWAYKNSDDKIKVEVWDAVDRVLADEQSLGSVDDDDAPAGAWPPLVALRAALLSPPDLLPHDLAASPPPSCRLWQRVRPRGSLQ